MIYDLHTHLSTHTHLHKHIISWHAGSRSGVPTTAEGYTRSVPGALDWQVGSCDVGKLKTMLPLSLENPLQAPWKERKGGRIRKREREQGMMFSIVFLLQWKCHYRPPCVCVQLRASYIKALRLFNNSRAPLMERQMGQWWWSRRCLCEPTEKMGKSKLYLQAAGSGSSGKSCTMCPVTPYPSRTHAGKDTRWGQ